VKRTAAPWGPGTVSTRTTRVPILLPTRGVPPIPTRPDTLGSVPESPGRPVVRTVLVVVAVVLLVLVIGIAGAGTVLLRRPLPPVEGEVTLDGLTADVEIVRDPRGVPHIYADDARDLFRAQGYVHAQDRFFQMDYRRRLASGRLAELVGDQEGVVESDSVMRAFGWRAVAEEELAMMSPRTAEYLAAYADGVNDYVRGREASRLGVEYTLLGLTLNLVEVEPWTEIDSLVWLKALTWDLSRSLDLELERAAVYDVTDDVRRVEQLFPGFPEDRHSPVLQSNAGLVASGAGAQVAGSAGGAADAGPAPSSLDALRSAQGVSALEAVTAASRHVRSLAGEGAGIGSNSWVLAGERTESGSPLLAVDPHMSATVPSVWYQSALHCRDVGDACPFDVSGFGFAGLPGIVSGHNPDVAWGVTSLTADVTDLFLERVFDNGTYLRDGQRAELERRIEVIEVNGGEDVELEIFRTIHGPVLSGVLNEVSRARRAPVPEGAPGTGLRGFAVAVSTAALAPGRTLDGFFALDAARTPDDIAAAADLIAAPTVNLVFATRAGDIGYEAAGQVPRRAAVPGAPTPSDGRWPRPGWDSRYDWLGFLAPAALPRAVNPDDGYIVAANQAVLPSGGGPFLGREWDAGYRAERITTLLEEAEAPLTVGALEEMQRDVFNPNAALLVPYLLTVNVDDAFVEDGVRLLRDWDLQQTPDSAAAAYFASVWANLLRLTFWDDMPGGFTPDGDSRWLEVVRRLLDDPQSPWWDDRTTVNVVESRDEVLIQALTNARLQLTVSLGKDATRWRWSKLHELALTHPVLGGDRFPKPVNAMVNPEPVPVGGGPSHVSATAWDAGDWSGEVPTFDVRTAPTMRMVVDLGDPDASTWVNLTGASGHPASRNYEDQLPAWAEGQTFPWVVSEEAVRERVSSVRWLRAGDGGE
jgi:penicillin amidase